MMSLLEYVDDEEVKNMLVEAFVSENCHIKQTKTWFNL